MKSMIKLAAINSRYSETFDAEAPGKVIEDNMNKTISFLHEAGRNHVDLVCTNEDFTGAGMFIRDVNHPEIFRSFIEEIPGPTSQQLGEIAKRYHMYIAANYCEKDGNRIYNTSILIDRKGNLAGRYRKVHPADGERWCTTGGEKFPVFETDIGKIGFAICYDIIFPEHCRALSINGADLIIHQTQGWGIGGKSTSATGEAFMRTRAAENSVYLVVAKNMQSDGGKSCVIDNNGTILAESQGEDEGLTIAEFVPDFDMYDPYNLDNYFAGVPSTRARQLLARTPSLYAILTDEKPPVLEKFKGMELAIGDQAKELIVQWEEISEKEKTKYHW